MRGDVREWVTQATAAIGRKITEEAAADANMPMATRTLAAIFDDIRTEALDAFSEPL